jgi:hypothetical protein
MSTRARTAFLVLLLAAVPVAGIRPAVAAPALGNCTGFVDALPATLSTPGTWCVRAPLALDAAGIAISIESDDVVLDCNGFAISGGPAATSDRWGIYSVGHQRVTVRHCTVSGFHTGISLIYGDRYTVEDNHAHDMGYIGIRTDGAKSMTRRNLVERIGLPTSGDYVGIEAYGGGTIADNRIENIKDDDVDRSDSQNGWKRAIGIRAHDEGNHYTITGNRIRGLKGYYLWGSIGIMLDFVRTASVRGNDIFGEETMAIYPTRGILCFGNMSGQDIRRIDNVVTGFASVSQQCPGYTDDPEDTW